MEGANAHRVSLQGDKNSLKFNTSNGFKMLSVYWSQKSHFKKLEDYKNHMYGWEDSITPVWLYVFCSYSESVIWTSSELQSDSKFCMKVKVYSLYNKR